MISNILRTILLITIAAIIYSCNENIVSDCEVVKDDEFTATFSSIQKHVFSKFCTEAGCHSGSEPQNNLDLTEGIAYENLVNVPSREDGTMRVEPGNSAGSLLMKKLNGDGTSQMPTDQALPQFMIDSITVWIDNGALNN